MPIFTNYKVETNMLVIVYGKVLSTKPSNILLALILTLIRNLPNLQIGEIKSIRRLILLMLPSWTQTVLKGLKTT
jgi:hypothetical protein